MKFPFMPSKTYFSERYGTTVQSFDATQSILNAFIRSSLMQDIGIQVMLVIEK